LPQFRRIAQRVRVTESEYKFVFRVKSSCRALKMATIERFRLTHGAWTDLCIARSDGFCMNQSLEELDALSCDFTAYLQQRLGVERQTAEFALAHWIAEYQPKSRHPVHVLERRCEAPDLVLESNAA